MLMKIVEKGGLGKNLCYMMAFSTVLVNCVFQLVPFD
jgi:hypothetical protein